MKKKLFLLVAALMAIGQNAFAYDFSAVAPSGQTLYYNIVNGNAQVTSQNSVYPYYSTYPTGALTIPSNVIYNGITYAVTSINDFAFYDCSYLTSVTISNSIISIGSGAFNGCIRLTTPIYNSTCFARMPTSYTGSYSIPNGIVTVCGSAFSGCRSLTAISIPNSVTSIGNYAFGDCSGLTSVTIPSSVTSIGSNAFYDVRHIVYHGNATGSPWGVRFLNGVIDGDFVYSDTTKHNLMVYIGAGGTVAIPNTVVNIGANAFYSFSNLTSVTIPSSVIYISEYAFDHCKNLTSVSIPPSVTTINYCAFQGCIGLTSVTIPSSVTSIGSEAFYDVRHIEYYGNAIGSPWGAISMNGVVDGDFVYSDATKQNLTAYIGTGGSVTIPNTVVTIGAKAFYNFRNLTSVTIPSSVTSIDQQAFYSCTGLTSVTIPNSVTSIGDEAFRHCSGLTSAIIGDGVALICDYTFAYCDSLTTVTIGRGVTSISSLAFCGGGLTSVIFNAENCSSAGNAFSSIYCSNIETFTIGNDVKRLPSNLCYNCSGLTSVVFNAERCISAGSGIGNSIYSAFRGCNNLTNITFGNNVKCIPSYLCYGCNGLTTIAIPDSVTEIGGYAFCGCGSLSSISVPNRVSSIGWYAFCNCTGLTSVTIPNSVTALGNYAFSGCSSLITVTIGNGVTSIGDNIFSGCSNLTSITIPCVSSIGNNAFEGCTSLTSVNYTGTIGQWCIIDFSGIYSNPIYYAHSLIINNNPVTNLVIPEGVTTIKKYAFCRYSSLNSVTIPNSVTSIGKSAFSDCNHLVTVRSKSVYPPTLEANVFDNIPQYCTLTVPCGSQQYYSVTTDWNSVFNIIEEDCRDEFTVTAVSANPTMGSASVDGAATTTVYDGDSAILMAIPNDGYRFVRWNDNDTHAVRTVTVTADVTYTAYFESTTQGITCVDETNVTVYVENGQIKVLGNNEEYVRVFNMMGQQMNNNALPTGVYLVKIGNYPARKVVVIR